MTSSHTRAFLLFACVFLGACDRSDELVEAERSRRRSEGQLTSVNMSPRRIIDETIAAYQRLTSYEDKAYVSLRYRLEGNPAEDRAPMSIAWDGARRLGLKVYSIEAGPSGDRWRLRIDRDDLVAENQVLSRAIPSELSFEWLLSDPTVAQGLAAGLAGFPPQLDLLLAAKPLQGLIDQATMLSVAESEAIDGRACYVIEVTRAGREYRLFIDQASMLLRRLKLPGENLPPAMLADGTVTDAELSIEFENVQVDHEVAWERFQVEAGADDVLVNHFLPPIQMPQLEGLGVRVPAFTLRTPTGEVVYDGVQQESERKAVVMMWLADHPSCRMAAEQLSSVYTLLQQHPQFSKQVRFVPIWAEPQPPAGYTFDTLSEAWQLPPGLALDREALGRDLFGIEQAPSVVVLDSNRRIQLRETQANPMLDQVLPALLRQLCAGRDLVDLRKREAEQLKRRMKADLRGAVAVDGIAAARKREDITFAGDLPSEEFMQLNHYPPLVADLVEYHRISHTPPVTSCAVDEDYFLWTLQTDGQIVRREIRAGSRENEISYETSWSGIDGERLLVAPGGEFVARIRPASNKVDIFDINLEHSSTIELAGVSSLTDVTWLKFTVGDSPRLAVITHGGEVLLLDPKDREQLSGESGSRPLALLPDPAAKKELADGLVILANRDVEPLKLSGDSILNAENGVRASSSRGELVSHGRSFTTESSGPSRRLVFQPAAGPWRVWADERQNWVLARGWLAKDEPGIFLLDERFQPQWHRRMPIYPDAAESQLVASARDPMTGLVTWFLSSVDGTIYILRADGLTDHFRPNRPFIGLTAAAHAEDLLLAVTRPGETQVFNVRWK